MRASGCCDARGPLLVFLTLGSLAVGAASANCYRITTLVGMNGVPFKSRCRRCRPSTAQVIRIAGVPCRHLRSLLGIPSILASARTRLSRPHQSAWFVELETSSTNRSHPIRPALTERQPRGPPLVSPVRHRTSSFRHAFTHPPEER